MQLGIPITTTRGGISAVKSVILYPSKTTVPRLQITPMATTTILISMALIDLKNNSSVNADNTKEAIKKIFISFLILSATMVLI